MVGSETHDWAYGVVLDSYQTAFIIICLTLHKKKKLALKYYLAKKIVICHGESIRTTNEGVASRGVG